MNDPVQVWTLCVECGPNVRTDEDGCCATCGNGAIGTWLDSSQGRETPAVKSVIDRLQGRVAELERERDELRGAVLRPLTEREVQAALHEGRAEAMAATGDNAWTSLLADRDRLRAECERLTSAAQAMFHAWRDVPAAHSYQRDARDELRAALFAKGKTDDE